MSKKLNGMILSSLVATFVIGLASMAFAAPTRSPIERRMHPGRGFWQNERPATTYRQNSGETRRAYSFEGVPFEAGDMAKVVNTTSLKVERNVLATVKTGEEFKVLDVQGPWVAAQIDVNGKPVRGWIYYSHVRPAGK